MTGTFEYEKGDTREVPDFASESGFKPPQDDFLDGVTYDGTKPTDYIESLEIGLKQNDTL